MVAKAFIPNRDNKPQVNHINGEKSDNRAENLEWCTNSENQIHSVKNGLRTDNKKVEQYDLNGNLIKVWLSAYEVYRNKKINYRNINSCCRRKRKTAGGYIWKYSEESED